MEEQFPTLPASAKAEAAVWIARLHSDKRTRDDELGLQAWLAEDEANRSAFAQLTQTWEEIGGGLRRQRATSWSRRRILAGGGGVAAAVALGGALIMASWPGKSYATAIGEQRRITLEDGSTVLLDTDTRIHASIGRKFRQIRLEQGRSHFEVASDPLRPFIVSAAHRRVVAIGTAFDVSVLENNLSVVLIEGRAGVGDAGNPAGDLRMMRPGDRLTIASGSIERLDRPRLDIATAWQSGKAVFDNEPLQSAVAEINRYGRRPIFLQDAALGRQPISGTYATGDAAAFARSVALLLDASVVVESDRILLREQQS